MSDIDKNFVFDLKKGKSYKEYYTVKCKSLSFPVPKNLDIEDRIITILLESLKILLKKDISYEDARDFYLILNYKEFKYLAGLINYGNK